MPAHETDPLLLVWLALRLKGLGEVETVAEVHGVDAEETEWLLAELQATKRAMFAEVNGVPKWLLTATGRDEGEQALAAELDQTGTRDAVEAAYQRFKRLNVVENAICTDWQVIGADDPGDRLLNEHTDAAYDAAVLDRLRTLNAELDDLLAGLSEVLARFGGYRRRFDAALARLDDGDVAYMATPIIGSYHTVFFELQEDLIASLGLRRATEDA